MNMTRMCQMISMFVALFFLAGCSTKATLSMSARKPPIDKSVVSVKMSEKKYSKIMVIPPPGISRGEFETRLVWFEREFLKHGVTVIANAVTGKVVSEGTAGLSDLERALVMANDSGADAILQISSFSWDREVCDTRFFIMTSKERFEEVSAEQYENCTSGFAKAFPAFELKFTGRVMDINGEVVATIDMTLPTNYVLPRDYVATLTHLSYNNWRIDNESFPYFLTYPNPATAAPVTVVNQRWTAKARIDSEELLIGKIVEKVVPKL